MIFNVDVKKGLNDLYKYTEVYFSLQILTSKVTTSARLFDQTVTELQTTGT